MELIQKTEVKTCGPSKKRVQYGLFLCSFCNSKVERPLSDGKRNSSCSCMRTKIRRKHRDPESGDVHPLYQTYHGIRARCYNPKNKAFVYYGGRGIVLCEEWRTSTAALISWAVNNGWAKGLEVDRVDNDGNYCPTNCEIVTHIVNSRRRPGTKLSFELAEEIRTKYAAGGIVQWELASEYDVSLSTIERVIESRIWTN